MSKQTAPSVFCLPGGKPDSGEKPLDTLVRELDEELGVRPPETVCPGRCRGRGGA
ncbi:NUDIX domain-containing protein [Streptomyces sp. NPDC058469]|uniref:NUDIX domain-containing protein n=1 Tax=Streptomyces sp. NPDC058469 TaxID=3346514 RepID=UPI0036540640